MRGKLFAIMGLVFLFSACVEEDPLKQATIGEEKMITILSEMNLAEGLMMGEVAEAKDSLAQFYIPIIMKKHEITLDEFNENLDLYLTVPDRAGAMFKKVKDRMEEITEGATSE